MSTMVQQEFLVKGDRVRVNDNYPYKDIGVIGAEGTVTIQVNSYTEVELDEDVCKIGTRFYLFDHNDLDRI